MRQCSDRGSMHKKKEVGEGEAVKGGRWEWYKSKCAPPKQLTKFGKSALALRRRTLAHVGLERAQQARLQALTVSLSTHHFRAASRVFLFCFLFFCRHLACKA